MGFDRNELIKRQKRYVLDILTMLGQLPKGRTFDAIARQLSRCSTSVGANYRAACRAKSTADFINKLKIVEEEADECLYFMGLLAELEGTDIQQLKKLMKEGDEILAIIVASIRTSKKNQMISKPKF